MAIKLTSTADTVSRFLKVQMHGKPGSGKTLSAATAPKPIILMTEPQGEDSLSSTNIEKTFGAGRPDISYEIALLKAYTAPDLEEALTFLESSPDMAHFDTVFADSGSKISKIYMDKYANLTNQQQAYGKAAADTLRALTRLLNLQKHVVLNCHTEPLGQEQLMYPSFEGKKVGRASAHDFGELYYATTDYDNEGKQTYVFQTRESPGIAARSRLGHLPDKVAQNWTLIFNTHLAGIAKKATPPAPVKPIEAPKPASQPSTSK